MRNSVTYHRTLTKLYRELTETFTAAEHAAYARLQRDTNGRRVKGLLSMAVFMLAGGYLAGQDAALLATAMFIASVALLWWSLYRACPVERYDERIVAAYNLKQSLQFVSDMRSTGLV